MDFYDSLLTRKSRTFKGEMKFEHLYIKKKKIIFEDIPFNFLRVVK